MTADNQAAAPTRPPASEQHDLAAAIEQLLAVNGNDVHLMRIANWLDLHAPRTNYAEAVLKAYRLLHLARIELAALRQDREPEGTVEGVVRHNWQFEAGRHTLSIDVYRAPDWPKGSRVRVAALRAGREGDGR